MIDAKQGVTYTEFNTVKRKGDPMEVVLRKYGNSTVLALPPALLKEFRLKAGQAMTLNSTPDGLITLAPKRRYALAELLALCDHKAAAPADLALWDSARPAGKEVW